MSDQTSVQQVSQTKSTTATQADVPPTVVRTGNPVLQSLIFAAAAAQIACFFVPWVKMLFVGISGYQISQLSSDELKLVWVVPVTALLAISAVVSKQFVRPLCQIAGATPFIALLYYCTREGTDLLQILDVGAYFTLFLGMVLIVLGSSAKQPKA